jgi:hypothetical protein
MELADESFPLEDNDFEDKERFVVIYDTTPDLGSHYLGILYNQLNHRASFPLTIENSESIEPVAEHWDMWFPLETILTQWIHMLRMGKITTDPRNEKDLSDEEANSRHQIGLWCWHPYCAAQIDSTVAAMDRYTDAIESRMQFLLPISRDAPFFTNAELDAALVPKECFIRSFLTRVRIPRLSESHPAWRFRTTRKPSQRVRCLTRKVRAGMCRHSYCLHLRMIAARSVSTKKFIVCSLDREMMCHSTKVILFPQDYIVQRPIDSNTILKKLDSAFYSHWHYDRILPTRMELGGVMEL